MEYKKKSDEIIRNAINILSLGKVIFGENEDDELVDVMNAHEEDAACFEKMNYPATWGHPFHMKHQIVASMHTIALCMQKNTVMMTLEFAALRNKKTAILLKMNQAFDFILDMKLDWCKVFPVESDKFGGWVSENWCSLGRIMKWMYSVFDDTFQTDEYAIPEKDVKLWNTKECDACLKHYGLKYVGNAKARRDFVSEVFYDCAKIISRRKVWVHQTSSERY